MRLTTFREAQTATAIFLVALLSTGPVLGGALATTDAANPGLPASPIASPVDETGLADVLVVLEDEPNRETIQRLQDHGLEIRNVFGLAHTVHAHGTPNQLETVSQEDAVVGIYENREITLDLATATLATNARNAWDDKSTSTNPVEVDGQLLDGTGVGVAVIDSGVDGTHPDLEDSMGANMRWACATPFLVETASGHEKCYANWQANAIVEDDEDLSCLDSAWTEMPNTDVSSGHGTHVASIVSGSGDASHGRHAGVAPGSTVYGLGVGHGVSVQTSDAVAALNWVLCVHDEVDPEIRIVNASWSLTGDFDPDHPINVAVDELVADGVVVVFAAGNSGAGSENTVNSLARNPTPGVVTVANYDDLDAASTEGPIAAGSSRCLPSSDAWECPDVAAPGTAIRAAQATTGPVTFALGHPLSDNGRYICCVADPGNWGHSPWYVGASGTSMAAPHVAGVAALVLQANASLTPAQVEDVLEDTAHPVGSVSYSIDDPDNPTSPVSPTAGHGLVDVTAALEDARVLDASNLGTDLLDLGTEPHVYLPTPAGNTDGQFLSGVQWTVPVAQDVTLAERSMVSGNATTTPLDASTPCRFVVDGSTTVPCDAGTLVADSGLEAYQMGADHAFASPGDHRIEAQVDVGGGFASFDAFTVHVVG